MRGFIAIKQNPQGEEIEKWREEVRNYEEE